VPDTENHLIKRLPRAERLRLLAICEPVHMALSEVLSQPRVAARYVYFPTGGYVSLVSLIEGSPGVEAGLVGHEGMLGAQFALGSALAATHSLVQGPGEALRIGAAPFREELARSDPLQNCLRHYIYVLMVQLTTSAACQRFHRVGPRLARWLLMSQDRARSDSFAVTQEFLAFMLGVRRVGVSAAASELQRQGLIEYKRGDVRVIDRRGLEGAACGCYGADRAAYAAAFLKAPHGHPTAA
jgi:CRP-like cAMP-binding protein